MDIRIDSRPLNGKIAAITSKSDAHRCLIGAALCGGMTEVVINDSNRDIEATADCLRALGAKIERDGCVFRVFGIEKLPEKAVLDCNESGSTLRFLLPVAAALGADAHIIGSGRLPERPLSPLVERMGEHGVCFSSDRLPMDISGKLTAGRFELPGNVSSQYITGLLLALPILAGDSEIILTTKLESAGYIDMTIRTLKLFGIEIERIPENGGYRIKGGQKYSSPERIVVEGDWSNAAFWLTAGAVGGDVAVSGLDADSAQGDKEIFELLGNFGARTERSGEDTKVSHDELSGIKIDAAGIPDLVPILAVCACAAKGKTEITNAARLRIKESDRLKTVAAMINALGGEIAELQDGLVINGKGKLKGGSVDSFNDHRIAMAAAIASVICEGDVVIKGAQAVEKSYPAFFEHFRLMGGRADVI